MLYSFRNKNDGEIVELEMKMCEREPYLENNPDWEQIITKSPSFGDPVKLGFTKPPSDFQDKIARMKHSIPRNNIKSKYWDHNLREI
jgi:hypothetical protein